jgi:hypothetical protein
MSSASCSCCNSDPFLVFILASDPFFRFCRRAALRPLPCKSPPSSSGYSPTPPFSLSADRLTWLCDALAAAALLPSSLSRRRGVALAGPVLFAADAVPFCASTLGVPAERNAVAGSGGAAAAASAAFAAAPVASALRRFAFSSTPRTRDAKVREHTVSAASAASGEACFQGGERG